MTRQGGGHLNDGELLRYLDGELSPRETKRARTHLEACWECRTQLNSLEETIGECVRYRNSVASRLPDPPSPWFDIQRACQRIDQRHGGPAWTAVAWRGLSSLIARPRRWSMALAALAIALLVVDQFRNAPSVKAAELLEKASAQAESSLGGPRYIQISSGGKSATRIVGGAGFASLAPAEESLTGNLRPLFEEANYSWHDPLSAASFVTWRDSLSQKDDEVTTVTNPLAPGEKVYRIRTTTPVSRLAEATLQLTLDQLQPVHGAYRFRGYPLVEISAVAAPPALPEPVAVAASPAPAPVPPAPQPEPELVDVARPATPAEELRVLAALHRLGADLGAPVDVRRTGGHVMVTGFGVNPELRARIQEELSGMPRVSVDLETPHPVPPDTAAASAQHVTADPKVEQFQARIEAELGGRAAYDEFTGEILDLSDSLMSRMHALRRLADRFSPENEADLDAEDREILAGLRREHAQAAADLSARIDEKSRPVLLSLGASALISDPELPPAACWQEATTDLFASARRTEFLLGGLLGGTSTGTSPQDLSTQTLLSLTELRIRTGNYLQNALQ